MESPRRAVLLIAHGSPARDTPAELRAERRRLHARAPRTDDEDARLADLEQQIRDWPRTDESDPYRAGTERLATELRALLDGVDVVAAYNEFCAPSVEQAVAELSSRGVRHIDVLSTMVTPGGGHSEEDIPAALEKCRAAFPDVELHYRWPYDSSRVAALLRDHLLEDHFDA